MKGWSRPRYDHRQDHNIHSKHGSLIQTRNKTAEWVLSKRLEVKKAGDTAIPRFLQKIVENGEEAMSEVTEHIWDTSC
jgi:hypothetical protein